jgi:hypothetical protein
MIKVLAAFLLLLSFATPSFAQQTSYQCTNQTTVAGCINYIYRDAGTKPLYTLGYYTLPPYAGYIDPSTSALQAYYNGVYSGAYATRLISGSSVYNANVTSGLYSEGAVNYAITGSGGVSYILSMRWAYEAGPTGRRFYTLCINSDCNTNVR